MTKYTSKPATVGVAPEVLDQKFADFNGMQDKLNELPEDQRAKIGEINFTNDSIEIVTPQVGGIVLRAVEREPGKVVLKAENSPVPMSINILYKGVGEGESEVVGEMEVEIPAMLKPLVGPALQKAVDQFGIVFASLA